MVFALTFRANRYKPARLRQSIWLRTMKWTVVSLSSDCLAVAGNRRPRFWVTSLPTSLGNTCVGRQPARFEPLKGAIESVHTPTASKAMVSYTRLRFNTRLRFSTRLRLGAPIGANAPKGAQCTSLVVECTHRDHARSDMSTDLLVTSGVVKL